MRLTRAILILCLAAVMAHAAFKLPKPLPRLGPFLPYTNAPQTNITLGWWYSNIVTQIYSTTNLTDWQLETNVITEVRCTLPIDSQAKFFICRASNVITGEVSGWNLK